MSEKHKMKSRFKLVYIQKQLFGGGGYKNGTKLAAYCLTVPE